MLDLYPFSTNVWCVGIGVNGLHILVVREYHNIVRVIYDLTWADG